MSLLFRYGQMTAGSFCYIGPQGIVHGTTVRLVSIYLITLLISNASFLYAIFLEPLGTKC